ncbi:MAG: hypothetical protein ISS41_11360 [Candidatus Aminicenantes bacterium]|nr:hypothetical protein [Candidatus Aminicenantes bacterium]
MVREKHELQPMKNVSLDVQFSWTMGIMAKFLKTTKKELRKVKKIIDVKNLKDQIPIKGSFVKMTFTHGFYSFTKKIKRKQRKILAPHPKVQIVLKAIKDTLVELSPAHENAFGFVKKRDIQMATRSLLGNTHFISFDITDAFPSITAKMVEKALRKLKIGEELIKPLIWLTTYYYNQDRRLPQGSSCSPALLNLVYVPMCQEIDEVCKAHGIKWCVYVDDFHFAALKIVPDVKKKLLTIPSKYGFSIKAKKIKDNFDRTIPHILGLTIVNGKIHIRRCTKKKFRRIFYMAWKHGAYSPQQVEGTVAAIRQTYGKEKNWPGWLREYWTKYQTKYQTEGGRNGKHG